MSKRMVKATARKRPRRIQKKIDRRAGYLRYRDFRQHVFISKLNEHIGLMAPLIGEQNDHIIDMNKEMMSIIIDATRRAAEG